MPSCVPDRIARVLSSRLATTDDIPALRSLMAQSIGILQQGYLSTEQIEASRQVMGLDTQLVRDGTYFVVHASSTLAGCGGWSRRATLFGGDHSSGRDAGLLDSARDAARVRAMYTAPAFARCGVGRLILRLCEAAARAEGFTRMALAATRAGLPLYTACGYRSVEAFEAGDGPVRIPLAHMEKSLC